MIVAVVLAGGKSLRMGSDKAKLKIGNITLLQHTTKTLKSAGIKQVFISGKQGIPDSYIDKGPVSGILACMEHLYAYDYIFFTPVDMPLINKYVILKLISQKNDSICYFSEYFLPLIISNNLINRKIIKQQIENNMLSVKLLLKKINAKAIKSYFPSTVFLNANSKKDWQQIQQYL